jgi:hypothetical protein
MSCAAVWLAVTVAVIAALTSATPARAQTIQIPDFRQTPSVAREMSEGSCNECGVIRSIREVNKRRDGGPAYATRTGTASSFDARVVGALVVMPFGPGSPDKTSFVGGAGTSDMRDRFSEVSYDLILRMDDGTFRTIERRDGAQYNVGDRVRIADGRLELMHAR